MRLIWPLPLLIAMLAPLGLEAAATSAGSSLAQVIAQVQPKIVKIYGAGGFRGLEAYQSGVLISADGHVLTAFSYVLDTDEIRVTLHDGRRLKVRLLGADPRLEIALLKIDAKDLPHFDLGQAARGEPGQRILALSNLFGVAMGNEPVSAQRGTISARAPLQARRGAFETPYDGPVYVLDVVTNNPGAAGGALVDLRGELLGLLGKELRNTLNNTWLNYALPVAELRDSVRQIREGKLVARQAPAEKKPARAVTLAQWGLVLVPDVLDRTPPYVDRVQPGSPAAAAGLRPDDLVVLVGSNLVQSCKALRGELERIDYEDPVRLTVLRGAELVELTVGGK